MSVLHPDDPRTRAVWTDQIRQHVEATQGLESQLEALEVVTRLVRDAFTAGRTLYTLGNGGSAADAQHLTGEMIGRYRRERRPLPAVTLTTDPTVMTCIANDYAYADVFVRQVQALVRPGDVVCAFTTSGRSPNVVAALEAARGQGASTVLFGGADAGAAGRHADHLLLSPSTDTPRIQEMHTLMLHMLSESIDTWAAEETR